MPKIPALRQSLMCFVMTGEVFGPTVRIKLHLLDIPPALEALQGVAMEIQGAWLSGAMTCQSIAHPIH